MLLFLDQALAGAPQTEGVRLDLQPEAPAPIINGEEADIDTYPMTGAMLLDADLRQGRQMGHIRLLLCSSTLIAPDVVLLAAHCIDDLAVTQGVATMKNKQYRWTRQVDLTDYDGSRTPTSWPDDAIRVQDWVSPDEWDLQSLQIGLADNHDIALLFLDTPVTDVPFAYLPTAGEVSQIVVDADVDVVGWGQQVATSGWESPPAGTYAIKEWGQSYINDLNEFEMQIGAVEDDVRKCHGDSGGPTFLEVESESPEKTRVIGVTSHAFNASDCDHAGGVDTRVDHYLGWIDEQMRERCADGSRVWCDEPGIPALPEPPPPPEVDDTGDGLTAGGCACSSSGNINAVPLVLGMLLLIRRRRGGGAS